MNPSYHNIFFINQTHKNASSVTDLNPPRDSLHKLLICPPTACWTNLSRGSGGEPARCHATIQPASSPSAQSPASTEHPVAPDLACTVPFGPFDQLFQSGCVLSCSPGRLGGATSERGTDGMGWDGMGWEWGGVVDPSSLVPYATNPHTYVPFHVEPVPAIGRPRACACTVDWPRRNHWERASEPFFCF